MPPLELPGVGVALGDGKTTATAGAGFAVGEG